MPRRPSSTRTATTAPLTRNTVRRVLCVDGFRFPLCRSAAADPGGRGLENLQQTLTLPTHLHRSLARPPLRHLRFRDRLKMRVFSRREAEWCSVVDQSKDFRYIFLVASVPHPTAREQRKEVRLSDILGSKRPFSPSLSRFLALPLSSPLVSFASDPLARQWQDPHRPTQSLCKSPQLNPHLPVVLISLPPAAARRALPPLCGHLPRLHHHP